MFKTLFALAAATALTITSANAGTFAEVFKTEPTTIYKQMLVVCKGDVQLKPAILIAAGEKNIADWLMSDAMKSPVCSDLIVAEDLGNKAKLKPEIQFDQNLTPQVGWYTGQDKCVATGTELLQALRNVTETLSVQRKVDVKTNLFIVCHAEQVNMLNERGRELLLDAMSKRGTVSG
ncbi:hypothetical protein EVB91_121 [Rhizobium phage RHph_I1_18]|nr:hypothetical protein EVB91_121 [Rhizobium phage RHph_I1_18]